MKYWIFGSDDKKIAEDIGYAFRKLGYEFDSLYTGFDSQHSIYFTWDGDKNVHTAYCASMEYKLLQRLFEMDDTFVKLNPYDFVSEPKFETLDVIYFQEKTYKRVIIIEVNKPEQKYRVKDYNDFEFSIPFDEQDQWGLVIKPKFKKGDMIKGQYTVLGILEVETQFQRYKVSPIGDVNNIHYLSFDEQDGWSVTLAPF